MTRIRHVDPNLMRASGGDLDAEQRLIVTLLEHDGDAVALPPAFARRLHVAEQWTPHWQHRHIDHELLGAGDAEPQGSLAFSHLAMAPGARELRAGAFFTREQYQSRRAS